MVKERLMNKKHYYSWLGSELKKYRLSHKLTLVEVSEKIGVSFKQIQNYENGVSKMSVLTLIDLCNLYGVDYSELIKRSIQELDK